MTVSRNQTNVEKRLGSNPLTSNHLNDATILQDVSKPDAQGHRIQTISDVPNKAKNLRQMFEIGNYIDILKATINDSNFMIAPDSIGVIIGSLVFLARTDEAKTVYQSIASELSPNERIECQFYLGLGFCRRSSYEIARQYFVLNLRLLKTSDCPRSRYYIYQGLAFYRYFCCRFRLALDYATKAFHESIKAQYNYGRVMAMDLKAHALTLTGQASLGMRTFEIAADLARDISANDFWQQINSSILMTKSQFGLSHRTIIEDLESTLRPLVQDSFEQIGLKLELARQKYLRGQIRDVIQLLGDLAPMIHHQQHVRYHAEYCALLSQSYCAIGEFSMAWNLAITAEKMLDANIDLLLHRKIYGILATIENRLRGKTEQLTTYLKQIERLNAKSGDGVGKRIHNRNVNQHPFPDKQMGDDPLGDLMDHAKMNPYLAIPEIIRIGYLGILPRVMEQCSYPSNSNGVNAGAPHGTVVLNFVNDHLLAYGHQDVHLSAEPIGPMLKKLLISISHQELSKESLYKAVWGHSQYHPLRHDAAIYSAVKRLRVCFGAYESWIERTDMGYRLDPRIELRFFQHAPNTIINEEKISDHSPATNQGKLGLGRTVSMIEMSDLEKLRLNERQLSLLTELLEMGSVNARTYRSRFGVSEITATRDLTALHRQKFLKKIGQGRSICYALNSEHRWIKKLDTDLKGGIN